jgi:hypothetical protein
MKGTTLPKNEIGKYKFEEGVCFEMGTLEALLMKGNRCPEACY